MSDNTMILLLDIGALFGIIGLIVYTIRESRRYE